VKEERFFTREKGCTTFFPLPTGLPTFSLPSGCVDSSGLFAVCLAVGFIAVGIAAMRNIVCERK
jgi:hypothetical protein